MRSIRPLISVATWVAVACVWPCLAQDQVPRTREFAIDDYFRVHRIVELTMSLDGSRLAFISETHSIEKDQVQRSAYIVHLNSRNVTPVATPELSDARQLTWLSDSREVAFLSTSPKRNLVRAFDPVTRKFRTIVTSQADVLAFKVSANEDVVAYTTSSSTSNDVAIFEQLRHGQKGLTIDPAAVSFEDFTHASSPGGGSQLWIQRITTNTRAMSQIPVPGDVQDFHWSPDGKFLSVTYAAASIAPSIFRESRTSLGILNVQTGSFVVRASASESTTADQHGVYYSGGEWIPGSHELLIRRVIEKNSWQQDWAFPEIVIAPVSGGPPLSESPWAPLEIYLRGTRFLPASPSLMFLETRHRGVDSLFEVTKDGMRHSAVMRDYPGSNSQFCFSQDFRTLAFVHERLAHPPEIYVRLPNGQVQQVSNLNAALLKTTLPRSQEVRWESKDGTEVSGWLLTPPEGSVRARPWPLITYVHGGPHYAFPDAFAPYFTTWPYPFEVFALSGMAVFLPNYRGTLSYGKEVAIPDSIDGEPIDDIVSGIEYLVRGGVADGTRLGIAGHSHGGWLGALTATRTGIFRAASFAEGWSSHVMLYEVYDTQLNLEVHEAGIGEPSLYEAPSRYLELSPDLHIKGLATAMLIESGSERPLLMLGLAKAAQRFGLPTEFVVYPNTGHTITSPRLQRDSAVRNLNWFRFWLIENHGAQ